MKRLPYVLAALAVALIGAAVVVRWLHRPERPRVLPEQGPRLLEKQVASIPSAEAKSCAACHTDIFNDWQSSQHARANRALDRKKDRAAFHPARQVQFGDARFSSFERKDEFHLRLEGVDYTPEAVIAVEPLVQYLIPFPGGRLQVFEPAFDPSRNEWFEVFAGENRQPDEWGFWTNRGMNWNSQCAACHMTGLDKGYQAQTDTYRTTWQAMGISCAQCHANMESHVKNPGAPLLRPSKEQVESTCASCHSRREELTGKFQPGENYLDHYRPVLADLPAIYHPDGQVNDENFEHVSFLMSRMHLKGVNCLDCHNPHSGKLVLPVENNALCMSCHGPAGRNPQAIHIEPARHMFHADSTPGGRCIDCHMPQNLYMQRDLRRDHLFGSPDPQLTKELGIPNACNRCHANESADWAIEWTNKWYGEKMERRARQRARVIARAQRGEDAAVPELLAMANSEEIAAWRAPMVSLLAPWAAQADVRAMLDKSLRDSSPLVRNAALRAFPFDPAFTPTIKPLCDDPVRLVRVDAAWHLRGERDRQSPSYGDLLDYLAATCDQPAGALRQAQVALDEQRLEDALAWSAKAAKWDATSAESHRIHALVLNTAGRRKEAIAELQKACELEPRNAQLPFLLALAYGEASQPEQAIMQLRKTVEIDPDFGRAWYNLGLALAGREDLAASAEALERAEKLLPQTSEVPYALATVYLRAGRIEQAKQAAERALALGHVPAAALLRQLSR